MAMRAPSSLARRAMAHARLRLLAIPNTTPVFPSRSMALLLPFFRRDLQSHLAPVAADHDFDLFAGAQFAERVGVIINILDRRFAEPRDEIAGLQPGTLGGRACAHAVEFHAVALIRVVGDRAEIDAEAAGGRLRFALHFGEGDALRL